MMKTLTFLILLLPFVLSAAQFDEPYIWVQGTAKQEVVPNKMDWSLMVRTEGKEISEVAEVHRDNVAALISFLEEQGIPEKEIQTARMQFGEDWRYINGERQRQGYFASTEVSFELKNLDVYEEIWTGLSRLDAVSVNNTSFDHTEKDSIRDEVRVEAVKAAKEKAQALAGALDQYIDDPLMIQEEPGDNVVYPRPQYARAEMAQADEGGRSLSVGTMTIRAQVTVAFELDDEED